MEKLCESTKRFGKGKATANGSFELLDRFIRKSGDRAYRFAYGLAGNCEEAKELVQEALYRVARDWARYDPSRPLESWFFTVLRNAFYDGRRRYERTHSFSLNAPVSGHEDITYADTIAEVGESPLDGLLRAEAVMETRRALSGLVEEHRAVLMLCDMDGLAYDEAARHIGVPVGTVRSRLSRARQAFCNRPQKTGSPRREGSR